MHFMSEPISCLLTANYGNSNWKSTQELSLQIDNFVCYLVTDIGSRPVLISLVVSIVALPDIEMNFVKSVVAKTFGIDCRLVTSLGSTFAFY